MPRGIIGVTKGVLRMKKLSPFAVRKGLLFLFVSVIIAGVFYHQYGFKLYRPQQPFLIAHAGGAINGRTYTNSLEAFEFNYASGHRFFEVDFSWTTDGNLVLIHDWTKTFLQWFNAKGIPSLKQFKSIKMRHGMTQMSLDDLYIWLSIHEDAYIITDIKNDNLAALKLISKTAAKQKSQIIPQIYNLNEFVTVTQLGFKDIILTLYRMNLADEKVIEFAVSNKIFAVTMPVEQALSTPLAKSLMGKNIFVYAHTVNSLKIWRQLNQTGVAGIYTDVFAPIGRSGERRLN